MYSVQVLVSYFLDQQQLDCFDLYNCDKNVDISSAVLCGLHVT